MMMKEESVLADSVIQDLCAMIKTLAKCESKTAILIPIDAKNRYFGNNNNRLV